MPTDKPSLPESELWNCPKLLKLECPMRWDDLAPTADADVRFCGSCERDVFWCDTPEDFIRHGQRGRCVAIPREVTPQAGVEDPHAVLSLGEPRTLGEPTDVRTWWYHVLNAPGALRREHARCVAEILYGPA